MDYRHQNSRVEGGLVGYLPEYRAPAGIRASPGVGGALPGWSLDPSPAVGFVSISVLYSVVVTRYESV